MFQSEPICILKAGPTIDGRHTDQQVIDDIADTYTQNSTRHASMKITGNGVKN